MTYCWNNTFKLISTCENLTRVISRNEYDSVTNQCVGLVLPLGKNGLIVCDSFLTLSFEYMENMLDIQWRELNLKGSCPTKFQVV